MITELRDISLLPYNTFGIDVRAARLLEYDNAADLDDIFTAGSRVPFLHIGCGSNLLFTRDQERLLLHTTARDVEVTGRGDGHVTVRVAAGMVWDDFVARCVAEGWTGAENLSLIPGQVGASAVQNIGAYGVEACDLIARVEAFDTTSRRHVTLGADECGYAYRDSRFKHERQLIVTHVTYRLGTTFRPDLSYGNLSSLFADGRELTPATLRQAVIDVRRAKLPDPAVLGNAGSFFMNPVVSAGRFEELRRRWPDMPHYDVEGGVKVPAGWLIEQCGWKGKSLGRAAVHDRQALVLVNLGGATADEVMKLAETVCHDVAAKFGVTIKPEVNLV